MHDLFALVREQVHCNVETTKKRKKQKRNKLYWAIQSEARLRGVRPQFRPLGEIIQWVDF